MLLVILFEKEFILCSSFISQPQTVLHDLLSRAAMFPVRTPHTALEEKIGENESN